MTTPRGEVFDWAAFEPQAEIRDGLAPRPIVHLPQVLPGARLPVVEIGRDGMPHYAYRPAEFPAFDPQAQMLEARGKFLAGVGVCALGVGGGCWLLFDGLARVAVVSIVGLGVVAAAVIYLKMSSGVRIGNVHQGDGSNFQVDSR